MSNARDTETSPLTPEQNQRAEALRIAASILSDRGPFTAGSLPRGRTPDDVITLADFILEAAFVGEAPEPDDDETCDIGGCERPIRGVPRTVMDYTGRLCAVHAPEPEAGDASATEKVTECQWPGCDNPTEIGKALGVHLGPYQSRRPACAAHAGQTLALVG